MGVVKDQWKEDRGVQPLNGFDISGVYLLKADGSILTYKDVGNVADFEVDIFGAMFAAIKIFIEDSLQSSTQIECINYSGFKILIENKKEFFLVMVGTGAITESVKDNMKWLAERIALDFEDNISRLEGDDSDMASIHGIIDDFTKSFVSK